MTVEVATGRRYLPTAPFRTEARPVDVDAEQEREAWLAQNTFVCTRLHCRITRAQCEANRRRADEVRRDADIDYGSAIVRPPACRECDGSALQIPGQDGATESSPTGMDICRACGKPILPKAKRPHGIHLECYRAFLKLPSCIRSRGIVEWIATVESARIEAEEERSDYTEKEFEAVLNEVEPKVGDIKGPAAIERPAGDVILAGGEQFRVLGTGKPVSEVPTIGGLSRGMVIHKSAVVAYGLDSYSHIVVGAQGSERIALRFLQEPAPGSRRIGAEKKGMHVALADLVRIFDGRRGPWELKRTNEPGVFVADLS